MPAANEGRKPMIFEGTPFANGTEYGKFLDDQRMKRQEEYESLDRLREVRAGKKRLSKAGSRSVQL